MVITNISLPRISCSFVQFRHSTVWLWTLGFWKFPSFYAILFFPWYIFHQHFMLSLLFHPVFTTNFAQVHSLHTSFPQNSALLQSNPNIFVHLHLPDFSILIFYQKPVPLSCYSRKAVLLLSWGFLLMERGGHYTLIQSCLKTLPLNVGMPW